MADTYRRTTRVAAVLIARIIQRMHDMPLKGTHVGGGIHVDMPDTFVAGQSNPGWTAIPYRMLRRLHPVNDDWGCIIRDETKQLFADVNLRNQRLTPAQITGFQNADAASIPLDPTWDAGTDDGSDPTT